MVEPVIKTEKVELWSKIQEKNKCNTPETNQGHEPGPIRLTKPKSKPRLK